MSLSEIAKKAGVSTATVSRALNDRNSVKPKTLDKVLTAYAEVGVTPRKYRRRKRMSHKNGKKLLCLFSPIDQRSADAHQLLEGLSLESKRRGAEIYVNYLQGSDCEPIPESYKPDGAVIFGKNFSPAQIEALQHIPAIWLYSGDEIPARDRVQPDHYSVGVKALNHLADKGYQEVCVFAPPETSCVASGIQRLAGFQMAALQREIPCHIIRGSDRPPENDKEINTYCRKSIDQFLALSPRPQGIFVTHRFGSAIYSLLIDRGIKPMRDLTLIGGDTARFPDFISPRPVTVNVYPKEVGETAISILFWRFDNPHALPVRCLTRANLVVPA